MYHAKCSTIILNIKRQKKVHNIKKYWIDGFKKEDQHNTAMQNKYLWIKCWGHHKKYYKINHYLQLAQARVLFSVWSNPYYLLSLKNVFAVFSSSLLWFNIFTKELVFIFLSHFFLNLHYIDSKNILNVNLICHVIWWTEK